MDWLWRQIRRRRLAAVTIGIIVAVCVGAVMWDSGAGHRVAIGSPAAVRVSAEGSRVLAWGDDFAGQTRVPAGIGRVTAVAAGAYHSLALRTDGTVIGWGDNSYGQARPPAGLSGVRAIAAGNFHSLALTSGGRVVGWGLDGSGQADPPAGLADVTAIAAGKDHSLALRADGTVLGWGNNRDGQTTVPAGLRDVVSIAAGASYSLALRSDGTVVGWGFDGSGQASPPAGLTGVVAIAAGWTHALALRSDGSVVGWGYNGDGQARPPAGLTDVATIAAGGFHSLALTRSGKLVAWGYGGDGQLPPASAPSDIVAIAAGGSHSLAVASSETPDVTTVQDNAPAIRYDAWSGRWDSAASGGTYRDAATAGATATFRFSGTAFQWVTRRGPDQGIAGLSVDGRTRGQYDLYAATGTPQARISVTGLSAGGHTVIVTVTGRRNAAASGSSIAVDAFVVGTVTTQDTANAITWATWSGNATAAANGGSYRSSGAGGATASLSFTGEQISLVTASGPAFGKAQVLIDGVWRQTLDLYRATAIQWRVLHSYGGLATGRHTITVKVLGSKNAASSGTRVVVDAFVISSSTSEAKK